MAPLVLGTLLALAVDAPPWSTALVSRHSSDLPKPVAESVHTAVRNALERAGTLTLQGAADTGLGMDQAEQAGWRCVTGEARCMAQLGRSLAVQRVVLEEVSGPASAPVVTLSVVDVQAETRLGRTTTTLAPKQDAWPITLRAALETLPLWGASLRLHFAQGAAELDVDGRKFPNPPRELTIPGLSSGPHTVKVVMEDLTQLEAVVDVAAGHQASVWVADEANGASIQVVPPRAPPATEQPAAKRPVMALVAGAAGMALGAVGGVATLGAAVMGVAGALLLGTLTREPGTQRIMAGRDQTLMMVQAQLGSGLALLAGGLVAAAVGVVLGVAGLGASASALVAVLRARGTQEGASP